MNSKQLNRTRFDINNGDSAFRLKAAEEAIPALRQDLNRLREKAESQCREFAVTMSAWTMRDVGEMARPVGIEQDLREARLINAIAAILTVTELALTLFVSLVFAVSAPFLLLVALVAIFALKVGLLALWRNQQQPQRTRRRLRRFIIAPSLVVTMLALTALVFARTAGLFALLLLPFINLAICALSLGILGLAAGLYALGFLMSWSRHAEKRFNAVEREAVETRRALQEAERVVEELRARRNGGSAAVSPPTGSPALSSSRPAQPARVTASLTQRQTTSRRTGGLLTVLALATVVWSGGCKLSGEVAQGGAIAATSSASPQVLQQAGAQLPALASDAALMEIWLDWSLSADAQPFKQAASALVVALPRLAVEHNIARVTAYQFGDRGWSAAEILSLDLPVAETAALGEAGVIYGNLKKEQNDQANQRRLLQLRETLKPLTPERLLPANGAEPPCTDLQGVFARIAETSLPRRRLIFLLTDGHETCSRLPRTPPLAESNAALVVVVLPEDRPRDQKAAAERRPDEVWRQRHEELSQVAPGAVVIPYFGDLEAAAAEALSKPGPRPKN